MRTELTRGLRMMGWLLRKSGPYLALEILLPGGTLLALLLFLYQRRAAVAGAGAPDRTAQALRRGLDAARDLLVLPAAAVRLCVRSLTWGRASV